MVTLKQTVEKFTSTLKKFFRMGFNLKGKVVTGKEAEEKLAKEQLAKSALTDKEISFVLTKLRQAQYSGAEFEIFHNVFLKLSSLLKK